MSIYSVKCSYKVYYTQIVRMEGVVRTNIDIDEELLEQAFSVSHARSKKDLIHDALREYVKLKMRKDLTELAGTIEFHEAYDHKKLRNTRDDSC